MSDFDDEGDDLLSSVLFEDTALSRRDLGDNLLLVPPQANSETADSTGTCQDAVEESVVLPESFPFPFEPYDIQKGFMAELYRCLQMGKIGIFESPTGTGKSLSLICGALRWLKDFQEEQRAELKALIEGGTENGNTNCQTETNASGELDWIAAFANKQKEDEERKKVKEEMELRLKREDRLKHLREKHRSKKRKRHKMEEEFDDLMKGADSNLKQAFNKEMESIHDTDMSLEDENIVLREYHSDEEEDRDHEDGDDVEEEHVTKIYYCSRTHSQLAQFVREIMKSPYGEDTRVVSLGSRQNLCINPSVRRLKSLSLINDTCLDLQKNKCSTVKLEPTAKRKKSSAGCPFYKQDSMMDFKDKALVEVRDVEQLVTLGKEIKACPYYGTRFAVPDAEIVALPYNTLLHKSTRDASGIKLKDNIVIIDEAHNLLETVNSVHSVEVTGAQIVRAHSQLSQYEAKYRSRLKAQNLMYIKQILYILSNLARCMGGKTGVQAEKQNAGKTDTRLWTINDFLFHSQLDNLNLFKVLRYCQRSQISKKLHGFVEKYQADSVITDTEKKQEEKMLSGVSNFLKAITNKGDKSVELDNNKEKSAESEDSQKQSVLLSSPLMHIESFLLALTNADKDGRIVIHLQVLFSQSRLKFLLLNPAVHFSSVLQEARAVVVAGGTMQPISEFKDQLFHAAGVSPDRILEYSCGHVIPAEQLLPIALSHGPTGQELDFTYQTRTKPTLLDEVGCLICNVCNVVPGGVVCFFPSYDYEKLVYNHWEKTGTIGRLANKKKVFREPKRAGQADQVLAEYSQCIQNCSKWTGSSVTGSILFCVVGGKMSEGINFSDDLGRCVVMIGMPYPNINSPELKEKMDYLNANFPKDSEGRLPGQVHYENLCMKAVNQSIGRAIRHRGDYATILLLDRRYLRNATVGKLPGWISEHVRKMEKFGPAFSAISKFFAGKKDR